MEFEEISSIYGKLQVSTVKVLVHEAVFTFGNIPTEITIKVYRHLAGENPFSYELSHSLKFPQLESAWDRKGNGYRSIEAAILFPLDAIGRLYNDAIKNGHSPSESWFVEK